METVIRVVGNKQQQGNKQGKQEEAAAEDKKGSGSESKGGDGATNTTTPTNSSAVAGAKPGKERKRIESSEMDVDRIIDAQDNEYVLSKPRQVKHPSLACSLACTSTYAA